MKGRRARFAGTEPQEGAGEFFQIGGEVFRAHGRVLRLGQVLFTDVGLSGVPSCLAPFPAGDFLYVRL